jgi:hypothetical protein
MLGAAAFGCPEQHLTVQEQEIHPTCNSLSGSRVVNGKWGDRCTSRAFIRTGKNGNAYCHRVTWSN